MSKITWTEKDRNYDNWQTSLIAASFGATLPSPASAIAAATLMNLNDEYNLRPVRTTSVKQPSLWKLFKEYYKDYREYRGLMKLIGKDLEIPFYRVNDIVAEARHYKWIEAEKAGRDIWVEKCPSDPEGCAVREWVARHFDAWKQSHLSQKTA